MKVTGLKRWFVIMTVGGALGGLVACNSNETLLTQQPAVQSATPANPPADNARRITADELHKLWEKNDVMIIDTRAESAYKAEHIKGSILMTTGTVLDHLSELPRNKLIAAYCT
jgi:3-mercaptopyruvate sulfurtransferase SseA